MLWVNKRKELTAMAAIQVQQQQLQEMIAEGQTVLVDFWAPWCTYCLRISDAYDAIAEAYAGQVQVVKINIDDNEAFAQQEKIELIPTLRLYQHGKAVASTVAPESKAAIETFLSEILPQTSTASKQTAHDMVIIGGGPGGYTAALYAVRAGLDTLVLEKLSAGGQMALSHQIDNYPGFAEGIDGFTLAVHMQNQAQRFGAKTQNAEVYSVDLQSNPKVIHTSEGDFYAKTVVIATGANPRKLGLANEQELMGRGVAYCAACDGMFYKNKTVVVVGGGNTAAADALLLSRIARKVILVHRRDTLRAAQIEREPLEKAANVTFQWNSVVTELLHEETITGVRLQNTLTGEETVLACDGVFISIGREPASQLTTGQLETDHNGYIIAGEDTKTSIPGVYVVGDVRTKPVRQIVTAIADGAMAVHAAEGFLAANQL